MANGGIDGPLVGLADRAMARAQGASGMGLPELQGWVSVATLCVACAAFAAVPALSSESPDTSTYRGMLAVCGASEAVAAMVRFRDAARPDRTLVLERWALRAARIRQSGRFLRVAGIGLASGLALSAAIPGTSDAPALGLAALVAIALTVRMYADCAMPRG